MRDGEEIYWRLLPLHLTEDLRMPKVSIKAVRKKNMDIQWERSTANWNSCKQMRTIKQELNSMSASHCLQLQQCSWPIDAAGDLHHEAAHPSGQNLEKLMKEIKWELESPWSRLLPAAMPQSQQISNNGSNLQQHLVPFTNLQAIASLLSSKSHAYFSWQPQTPNHRGKGILENIVSN